MTKLKIAVKLFYLGHIDDCINYFRVNYRFKQKCFSRVKFFFPKSVLVVVIASGVYKRPVISNLTYFTDVDDCERHKCENGDCVDEVMTYTCQCKSGFVGRFCDGK